MNHSNYRTQIVILGGSGDLSKRKLLPALLDLYAKSRLPDDLEIVGVARTPRSDDDYREFVRAAISEHHNEHSHPGEVIEKFCSKVKYLAGSFDTESTYSELQSLLSKDEIVANKLFYLAVPPELYGDIFTKLHSCGIANDNQEGNWTRILVEKPFGRDFRTAQTLDQTLSSLFDEEQIFRIDHYLAKEAVQNILSFRFANTLLKYPWNKEAVRSVEIEMRETIDVGHRAGFYEGVGALRDVGQNHLLQLLALVAMREPACFNASDIRIARNEVLESLQPISTDDLENTVLRAQYDGYVCAEDIPDASETETYFELKAFVGLPEWEGVPFFIRAGKALDNARVSITINFHDIASGLFETASCNSIENQIVLTISPEQSIDITLNAKSPGLGFQLESRTLSFTCQKGVDEIKNSYEKVLYDAIIGDQTLFTRTEEVLAAWKFITPILEHWQTLPLHAYKKGSKGPEKTIIN